MLMLVLTPASCIMLMPRRVNDTYTLGHAFRSELPYMIITNNNNNNRRLVTLAEHTSDHGRQTNSSTEEKGEQV